MAPFFQRCVKKWSTFPKRVSKSDTPSKARKIIIKKGVPNHIGTNINQIVHNNNSGLYSETDKEQLVAYMRKLNVEVNKVYEVISERKSGNM